MKTVEFTPQEIGALYELGAYVIRSVPQDADHEPLKAAVKKLQKAALDVLCTCCRCRLPRRADGICDPCHSYRERHGHLPPAEILAQRSGAPRRRTKKPA